MSHPKRRPRIFIVSSTESLSVVNVVTDYLTPYGDVARWDLADIWPHGDFILQALLDHAPNYDFAVIVFGRDDKTINRGNELYAPRDNVIFEAGLFMAHLGHKRTFIVAPKGHDLKILSDLAGLVLLTYGEPTPEAGLGGALKSVCDRICREIEKQELRSPFIAARPGPDSFGDANSEITKLLDRSRKSRERICVLNIALDMEFTWGLVLRDYVMESEWPGGLKWRSLIVDSEATEIKQINCGIVSVETAKNRENAIVDYCQSHETKLKARNIDFKCRAYSTAPLMHGFVVGKALHVGFCWSKSGSISCVPYLSFSSDPNEIAIDAHLAERYIRLFNGWFAKHWRSGRRIWPND